MQAVSIANVCQNLQCLPRSGGFYDQDYYDALKLLWVMNVQAEKREQDRPKK